MALGRYEKVKREWGQYWQPYLILIANSGTGSGGGSDPVNPQWRSGGISAGLFWSKSKGR